MAKYNIGGYIFDDENKAKKAAKELKAVEYILGQIKESDERGVLSVYNKLIKQRLFSTEIGMGFLSQLRQNLVDSGVFSEKEIPPVYSLDEPQDTKKLSVPESEMPKEESSPKVAKVDVDKKKLGETSDKYLIRRLKLVNRVLLVLCITLLLCVIGMFYVNSTINSPTILNYEEKILDKYSAWEQELTQREAAVKEKELKQQ
ncbi:MAG: hypothetical protein K5883_01485 [Pseudobutyrivibrio sp.]|nr:hypothetical protein [Pseudobutyrivibrio sp.]